MKESFDTVIFLGSSGLLYNCARKTRQFYGSELNIKVIETSYTAMKRKYISEFGDIGSLPDKTSIVDYLRNVRGNTLLFSINNPYIIPKDICERKNYTMINLHHALLPAHPGRNAEAWTIYEQDAVGGYTWHYISADVDAGDIILQEEIKITERTTSLSLLKQCEMLALKSFEKFLPFEMINTCALLQSKTNKRFERPKYSTEIPNKGILDLTWDFAKQVAFLNAMNYGAAWVLGKPCVCLEGEMHTIDKYELRNKRETNKEDPFNKDGIVKKIFDEKTEKELIIWLVSKEH